ncbi:GHKL domain-containing protein [Blautia schinkii]|nr:GHKL domain-containing protein [Blautia schinkii]
MVNGVSIHIAYNYITIVITAMFIGHFLFQRNMKYCILIGSIYLSISLLGQLLSCIFMYPYSGNTILAELPEIYQVGMMIVAEGVIVAGSLALKRIIERIPPFLSSINVITILIPLFLNIIVMAVCADNLYNDKNIIIGNIWSVITILIVPIVMFLGTVCNIVILENYLNVKKIENEKKLQISEMSLQYDYYMKQSKDMENIRRLSHDIKNHLEALKGNVEPEQKIEYINGIERKLNKYQSYYKSGNTFIDNLLHTKRLEAIEKKIEFKVFADFAEFKQVRDEDLCTIISNVIDNALRECRLMKEENPTVECLVQLKAKKVKGFLSILCENSLRESQVHYLRENTTMETSKEDKKNHGFGVKNIKSVVKDYGGEVSFNVLDDMFSVSVIIPIEI